MSSTDTPSWTEQLLALQGRPISDADRDRAALHLIDWLGCVLLSHTSPAGQALSRWAAQAATGPCWTAGGGVPVQRGGGLGQRGTGQHR